MRRVFGFVSLVLALMATGSAAAAAAKYNCKSMAQEVSPFAGEGVLAIVREWDEYYAVWDEEKGEFIQEGAWLDRGDDSTPLSSQIGCCWMKLKLQKGLDYTFSVEIPSGWAIQTSKADPTTGTSLNQIRVDGKTYLYVRADEWMPYDTDTVHVFYVRVYGGRGTVGQTVPVMFQQKSIDEFVEAQPGTLRSPIVIDVSVNGSVEVDEPQEKLGIGRAMIYSAKLPAGYQYVFTGTHPESDTIAVTITPPPTGFDWDSIPGSWECDPANGTFKITVTNEFDLPLAVLFYRKDGGSVDGLTLAGGTLAWYSEDIPEPVPPEPIGFAEFAGKVLDAEERRVQAAFTVGETFMDDGSRIFTATVEVENVELVFTDNGAGEVVNEREIDGKTYRSFLNLAETLKGNLRIDGSIYLEGEGVKEYFFGGDIPAGGLDPDSFESFDPATDSAADMGITAAAFKDEPAGSDELNKLWIWGVENGIRISTVNAGMSFTATWDPDGLLAMAYLLDCAPTEEAIEEAAADFVITAFDPATGVVTVAGDRTDGDDYGNGRVEIRTSTVLDGPYTTTAGKTGAALFYRAYLVKKQGGGK